MLAARNQSHLKLLLTLIFGIILGFSLSQLWHNSNCLLSLSLPFVQSDDIDSPFAAEYEAEHSGHTGLIAQESAMVSATAPLRDDDSSLADWLYNKTRVLCWVLTGPQNHQKRAMHVKRTWGARCNKLVFMSSKEDAELGAVKLPGVAEGRGSLWHKTREAVKYIYEHHFDEADWFLKADDDTYVIVDNLRAFLYQYSSEAPVYFGCKFKPFVRQGYMSGGAGYALSKEALRRFVLQAYPNPLLCRQRSGFSEDKEMGYCLQNVGVVAGDSRDEHRRGRFFPIGPQGHLVPRDKSHWYWQYIYYATKDGLNCCSDYAISFHYIQPDFFYVLDYLIYRLRAFGVNYRVSELPPKRNMQVLLAKWRNESSDNPL